MASPTIRGWAAPTNSADMAPAFAVTLPTRAVGDLLIAFIGCDTIGTAITRTQTAQWPQVSEEVGTQGRLAIFARIATNDANDNLSVAGPNNNDGSCNIVAITAGTHGVTDPLTHILAVAAATGTTGSADPPSINGGSAKDFLAFAIAVVDLTTTTASISGLPANHTTNGIMQKSASSTSSVALGVGPRALTATQSTDPGTFTNSSGAWIAKTILVPPPFPPQGEANGAVGWAGSLTGARLSKGEANGAIGWAGSATGSTIRSGAGTGAVGWAGSATGEMPAEGGGPATLVAGQYAFESVNSWPADAQVSLPNDVVTGNKIVLISVTRTNTFVGLSCPRVTSWDLVAGPIQGVQDEAFARVHVGEVTSDGTCTVTFDATPAGDFNDWTTLCILELENAEFHDAEVAEFRATSYTQSSATAAMTGAGGLGVGVVIHNGGGAASLSFPTEIAEDNTDMDVAFGTTVLDDTETFAAQATCDNGFWSNFLFSVAFKAAAEGPALGEGSASGAISWAGTATGAMPAGPGEPGIWQDVTPVGATLDPDDPSTGANFGFQSLAVGSDGTLYVAEDYHGLFKSTDNGTTWEGPYLIGSSAGTCWTLLVDPFNPNILWANSGYGSGGPFRSTDQGETWTKFPVGAPTVADDIYCVALDPYLADHMLVAWHSNWASSSSSGISESFDGGDTWTNHVAPDASWSSGHAVFFLSDSDTWLVTTQTAGVWRTDDGADTWDQVVTESMTHGATGCLTKIGTTLVIALEHSVRVSTDDGVTWTNISTGLSGDYFSCVATDGVNLYTAPSFPITPNYSAADGPWKTRTLAAGPWVNLTGSPDPQHGANANGPRQFAETDTYIFTVNYMAGVWRMELEAGVSEGSVAGAISWDGSVTGEREPKGSVSGAISWVGSSTGVRTPKGSGSGAIAWGGVAVGGNLGVATGAISWGGSVTGVKNPSGVVSGAIGWVGSSTGVRTPKGSGSGEITWGGVAVGGNLGVATGALSWGGSVTGVKLPSGSAAGAFTFAGTAEGSAPAVGVNDGSASGAISWAGSATGVRLPKGAASGAVDWAGVAVGGNLGVAIGAISWGGTVTGVKTPRGAVSGTIGWIGTANGETPSVGVNDGSANGVISWAGSASGVRAPKGAVSGAIAWAGVAVGGRLGIALGAIAWGGTAQGLAPTIEGSEGSTAGGVSWSGSVTGRTEKRGNAVGAISWIGVVTAVYTIDPSVFLLAPKVAGHSRRLAVGYRPRSVRGRDKR